MPQSRKSGFVLVITGAILWGITGTVAQKLFRLYGVNVNWLVTTRLLISGVFLLTAAGLGRERSQVFGIWKSKIYAFRLVIFGLFGMLAVQYTYMASIGWGNAAVATLLQYLAPVMIIVWLVIRKREKLQKRDILSVLLALGGCFFLLTDGSAAGLAVPLPAVAWGLLSGVSLAFYTLYAKSLLKQFHSMVVVGWAMVIGGFVISFVHPIWQADLLSLGAEGLGYLLFVIGCGTALAFWFYIHSLHSLSPKEASLLAIVEPLSAVLSTVFWLGVPFGLVQWVGALCIIGMIVLLAFGKEKR